MQLYNLPQDILLNIKIPVDSNIGNINIINKLFKFKIIIKLNKFYNDYELNLLFNSINNYFDAGIIISSNFLYVLYKKIKIINKNKIIINLPNNNDLLQKIKHDLNNILSNHNIYICINNLILIKYYPYNFKKLSKKFIIN